MREISLGYTFITLMPLDKEMGIKRKDWRGRKKYFFVIFSPQMVMERRNPLEIEWSVSLGGEDVYIAEHRTRKGGRSHQCGAYI